MKEYFLVNRLINPMQSAPSCNSFWSIDVNDISSVTLQKRVGWYSSSNGGGSSSFRLFFPSESKALFFARRFNVKIGVREVDSKKRFAKQSYLQALVRNPLL